MSPILGIYASQDYVRIPPSSYESIATATPSGTSTVTFSSIPSTYTSLQLRFTGQSSSGDIFQVRLNGDTGTNYSRHQLAGNGATVTAAGVTGSNLIWVFGPRTGSITSYFAVGIVDIHNYTSSTQNKTVRSFSGVDGNGSGEVDLMSGLWLNTAAVTSLTFFTNGGNFASGSIISLYGIKGA